MDRKYKLKHALANRYALTAVLFLAITLWGGCTVLLGSLELGSACQGYTLPFAQTQTVKHDPTAPSRTLSAAPAGLSAPAPVQSWPDQLSAGTAAAETAVTRALEEDHSLIALFGAYQRFADRTVVEDAADPQYSVVRLEDGSLTFVGDGLADPQVQAAELKRLQQALDSRDAALLYLQVPSKLEPDNTTLPYGVTDPSNACADRLLAALEDVGVDSLDLRQSLKDAGGDWSHWFFRTDHHWTPEAAFVAFQALAQQLEHYEQTLPSANGVKRQSIRIPQRFTDPQSLSSTTLPNFFLGSQGKRVGSLYAGVDDFTLLTPDYPTLLHYTAGSSVDRYGALDETVLFSQRVEKRDFYGGTPYTYYAGGDYALARITNYYNPQGPRILLLRDSFACPLTPYLALCSSQLTTVDPRAFSGNLLECIDWVKPDVVVVMYSSGMVRSEDAYRLLPQPTTSKSTLLRWKDDLYQPEK